MRVALVHDWLTGMRGGERVLEALIELFPDAAIFTLLHVRGSVSPLIEGRPIHSSPLAHVPGAARHYRLGLPLFPALIERFDLRGFDLVISSSHCVAKGVRVPDTVTHVCYCHTPMRYVWDQYDVYFGPGRASPAVRALARLFAPRLRRWDVRSARRVTAFVANSEHVRQRVRRHYGRDAVVIHPPVDVTRFSPAAHREDVYVSVGALAPSKRLDIAIDAFNRCGRRLIVVGDGPQRAALARRARRNITFAGTLSDAAAADLLGRARAFVLPGEEDFGIAAVEAQAAGTPVIALGRGGALETVAGPDGAEAPTGVFFDEPTPAALLRAIERFEQLSFREDALRARALRFGRPVFLARMQAHILELTEGRATPCASPM